MILGHVQLATAPEPTRTVARYNEPGTYEIPAGLVSWTAEVYLASRDGSPTLNGEPLQVRTVLHFDASPDGTPLAGAVLVLELGDDVLVTTVAA